MKKRLAVIAGAGVAGLTLAWKLVRQDWRVIVVEHAPDFRSGGYMLGLSGPGFETIRDMGLKPALDAVAHRSGDKVFLDRRGRAVYRIRYGKMMDQTQYLLLNRSDLVAVLHAAVAGDADIRFGTTVGPVELDGERALVTLSTGETLEADLLVGADGVRSELRARLFGPDERFFRPLGYRFAAYPLDNIMDLKDEAIFHTAPRHFAEYYPMPDGRLAALQVWPSRITGLVPSDRRWDLLREVAAGAHPIVREAIASAEGEGPPILDDLCLVEAPAWSKGPAVLVGDAAHCLTFISGQGAGMAIASCGLLGDALAEAPVAEALKAHERRVRPAIDALQKYSRRRARAMIPGSLPAYHLRNYVMRRMNDRPGKSLINPLEAQELAALFLDKAAPTRS